MRKLVNIVIYRDLEKTHLVDDGQNPRFTIVIAVRTNTQVDFVVVGVGFVGSS
jgi:hypothetical protein